jgi:predicted permease
VRSALGDVRYALRGLVRDRGFTAVALLTLSLGIGVNAAIFSVADAVLLRPLPYPDADRLVTLWEVAPDEGSEGRGITIVSSGNYLDWADNLASVDALAAYGGAFGYAMISDEGEPDQVVGIQVTPSLFRVLGIEPAVGGALAEAPGSESQQTVLLSHGLWEARFGGDPGVVGRTVLIEEVPRVVVGVMPPELGFPSPDVQMWLPLTLTEEDRASRRSHQWRVLGRLGPDRPIEEARAELLTLSSRISQEHPEFMAGWSATVEPYREDRTRDVRASVLLLLGTVGVVLLIACANVANLLLVRGVDRGGELALRRALGARTGRIVRQLVTETAVLTLLGLAGGVFLASAGLGALLALAPGDVPFLEYARLDLRVLGFTAAVAVIATLGFGLLPAIRASREAGALPGTLRAGISSPAPARLRQGFLVAQVAGAVVLVVGSGLLVRSLLELGGVDPGLDTTNLLAVSVDVPASRYFEQAAQDGLYEAFVRELGSIPGVVGVAGTTEPPVVGYRNTFSFVIEGRPRPGSNPREAAVLLHAVTPGYFETLGVPVIRGRALTATDRRGGAPVAVVNQALAERLWPAGDAVGARIQFAEGQPWIEIVGVVGDTRQLALDTPPEPALYLAHGQRLWSWMSWMTVLVRTSSDPLAVAPMVREALWRVDDRLPVRRIARVSDLYGESIAGRTFTARVLGGFAALALLLGTVGVYGVVAYSVSRRRHEIAVRMAVGARAAEIGRAVVAEGTGTAAAGVALGLVLALVGGRMIESLLFGVEPTDPLTFLAAAGVLISAAIAGSWVPALRAARVDPMECLRHG